MSQPIAAVATPLRATERRSKFDLRSIQRLIVGVSMLAAYARRLFSPGLLVVLVLAAGGCSREHSDQAVAPQRLFVTAPADHSIAVYENGASGRAAPLEVIKEPATDRPVAVGVDLAGEAFVANANGNVRVFIHRPGGKYELLKSFEGPNTRIAHPTALAVNPAGSFYLADAADGHGRVEWFSGGASGDIYVDRVIEGPRSGIKTPSGLAIDGAQRAFVTDRSTNRLLVFAADASGDAAPLAVIGGLQAPGQVAVDDLLNVYVAEAADNSIAVFGNTGPESWSRAATITSDALKNPTGLAIDLSGRIAVGAAGGILFFPNAAHGKVDPALSLTGPTPMQPAGICIH